MLSNEIPGPGTYDPKNNEKIPTYSLSKATREAQQRCNTSPGPGTYAPYLVNRVGTAM